MEIGKNKVVTLTYTLHLNDENGEIIQTVDEKRPFVHLFGAGTLLPAFEENMSGLKANNKFSFKLSSGDGYGDPSDEMIVEVEKKIFEVDGKIDEEMVAIGKNITMQDQNGNPIDGKVLAVKEDSIIMDFNHPLAGEDLYFTGTILDVRDASEEELSHGHVHGAGGHNH